MMRSGLVLALVVLLVAPAWAGRHDTWLEEFKSAGQAGDADAVLELFHRAEFDRVAKDRDALWAVCTGMDSFCRILTARGGDRVDEMFDCVLPHARAGWDEEPRLTNTVFRWASVVTAIERSRAARGKKPDLERWHEAVQLGFEVHAQQGCHESLALSLVRWGGELATYKAAKADACFRNADAILQPMLAGADPGWGVIAGAGRLYAHKAKAAYVRGKKGDALASVNDGLAFLETYLDADVETDDPRGAIGRAHCELITIAQELKLRCKAGYRVEEVRSQGGYLTATLPASGSWKWVIPDGDQQILSISKFGPEGRSLRDIHVNILRHGKSWDVDGTGAGVVATNTKALAERYLQRALWDADTVHEKGKVRKGRPGKSWPKGHYYRLDMTNKDGVRARVTTVIASCKSRKVTFRYLVVEFEDNDAWRREFDYVLSSLCPPK